MKSIRVLLADPQTLFREGLKSLFAGCEALEWAGDVARPEEVANCLEAVLPDVVLMEVAREAAQAILLARPATRVAFLTNRRDEEAFSEYRAAGAAGYILKDASFAELAAAVRTIHDGGSWVSAGVAEKLTPIVGARMGQGNLTAREQEVLKMTAEGWSVKEVAGILALSAKTVDAHKVNLMRKLRIHNKAHLVQYAYQNQILKLEYHGYS